MAGKIIVKYLPSRVVGKVALYVNGYKQETTIGKGETKVFSINKDCEIYGNLGGLKSSTVRVSANEDTEIVFNFIGGAWKNTLEIITNKVTSGTQTGEKIIFNFDGGVGDKLIVYEDKITLQHKGVLNVMAMGIHGDKTIYLTDITSIQFKPAGFASGHIQFSLIGGAESKGGILAAASDENTITFTDKNNYEADKIYKYLNEKLRQIKTARNTPSVQAAPLSSADELKKFKDLLDMGIITQEEFDAKKKQLLGL